MDIIEKFLDEPKLSIFIELCDHVMRGCCSFYNMITSTYITMILSKYPDLVWLIPYNFNPIKRSASHCSTNGCYPEECWDIFRKVFRKLRNKKLIID